MQWKKGFTMVELLVVLIILAILVAVAAPMYFANTNRARASEAVAMMGSVRQSERDYYISHNAYIPAITTRGDIQLNPPTGAGVDAGVAQYFSNNAYLVPTIAAGTGPAGTWSTNNGASPGPVDFLITVNGSASTNTICPPGTAPSNCAMKRDEVTNYRLDMDNTGRIFVSYDGGTTWGSY